MKKPNISQMKKKPSLWLSGMGNLHIKYPCGKVEKFYTHNNGGLWDETQILFPFSYYIEKCEFLGWL